MEPVSALGPRGGRLSNLPDGGGPPGARGGLRRKWIDRCLLEAKMELRGETETGGGEAQVRLGREGREVGRIGDES